MSKKTDLTSRNELQSNTASISFVSVSNWLRNESVGRKPDWLWFNSFSFKRKLYNQLKMIFLNILPNIGKR